MGGAAWGGYYWWQNRSSGPVACTMEAKQCSDGSYVGRTGPNCEFATCPSASPSASPDETADWQTYRNEKYGFEIKYPSSWKVNEPPGHYPPKSVILLGPDPVEGGMTSSGEGIYIGIHYLNVAANETPEKVVIGFKSSRPASFFSESKISFAGQEASLFIDSRDNMHDIIVTNGINVFYVYSGKYELVDVQKSLSTFKFTK